MWRILQIFRVVLAGLQLWVILPAPAADQGALDDQLLIAGQVLGGWSERTHHPRKLKRDRGDRPGDRRRRTPRSIPSVLARDFFAFFRKMARRPIRHADGNRDGQTNQLTQEVDFMPSVRRYRDYQG